MASTTMTFDDSRAREEIGYSSRPASLALFDSAQWFVEHGYVIPGRAQMILVHPPSGSTRSRVLELKSIDGRPIQLRCRVTFGATK